jgi:hypothetical protein
MRKRAVSEVIATVALVMITLAAVAVIAPVVLKFVKGNLDKSSECLGLKDSLKFEPDLGYNCVGPVEGWGSTPVGQISIRATNEEKVYSKLNGLNGFKIILMDSNSGSVSAEMRDLPMFDTDGQAYNDFGVLPDLGGVRTYLADITLGKTYVRAYIYPINKKGVVCEYSDSTEVGICS